jgi:hypothetical protein
MTTLLKVSYVRYEEDEADNFALRKEWWATSKYAREDTRQARFFILREAITGEQHAATDSRLAKGLGSINTASGFEVSANSFFTRLWKGLNGYPLELALSTSLLTRGGLDEVGNAIRNNSWNNNSSEEYEQHPLTIPAIWLRIGQVLVGVERLIASLELAYIQVLAQVADAIDEDTPESPDVVIKIMNQNAILIYHDVLCHTRVYIEWIFVEMKRLDRTIRRLEDLAKIVRVLKQTQSNRAKQEFESYLNEKITYCKDFVWALRSKQVEAAALLLGANSEVPNRGQLYRLNDVFSKISGLDNKTYKFWVGDERQQLQLQEDRVETPSKNVLIHVFSLVLGLTFRGASNVAKAMAMGLLGQLGINDLRKKLSSPPPLSETERIEAISFIDKIIEELNRLKKETLPK